MRITQLFDIFSLTIHIKISKSPFENNQRDQLSRMMNDRNYIIGQELYLGFFK
jgi:hypothetical protein